MGQTVGEMFVNLGIKGSEKTVDSLNTVGGKMGNLKAISLEAKAAILAAFYAIGKLVSETGAIGTGMANFTAQTGISVKALQQYQYAARQAGASNEEMMKTFSDLQRSMGDMLVGKGAPETLARMIQTLQSAGIKVDASETMKWMNDVPLLMKRLQEYANIEKNPAIRDQILRGFGLGDTIRAAFARSMFSPEMLAKAPLYSDKEVNQLAKADAMWRQLGNDIQMAFGRFNASHGPELVKDVREIAMAFIELMEAMIKVVEKAGGFKAIAAATKEATKAITGTAGVVDKSAGGVKSTIDYFNPVRAFNDLKASIEANRRYEQAVATRQQVVQQHIYFQSGGDPEKVKKAAKDGVLEAMLENNAAGPAPK